MKKELEDLKPVFLSVEDVCKLLQCDRRVIYAMIDNNYLKAISFGKRKKRIFKEDYLEFLNLLRTEKISLKIRDEVCSYGRNEDEEFVPRSHAAGDRIYRRIKAERFGVKY
jgi:excisionase family DNA binding protein